MTCFAVLGELFTLMFLTLQTVQNERSCHRAGRRRECFSVYAVVSDAILSFPPFILRSPFSFTQFLQSKIKLLILSAKIHVNYFVLPLSKILRVAIKSVPSTLHGECAPCTVSTLHGECAHCTVSAHLAWQVCLSYCSWDTGFFPFHPHHKGKSACCLCNAYQAHKNRYVSAQNGS